MERVHPQTFIFVFLCFLAPLFCEAQFEKAYNLCMNPQPVVSPPLNSRGFIRVHPTRNLPEFNLTCKLTFELCNTCRLWIRFTKTNFNVSRRCNPSRSSYCIPDCVYLQVVDQLYDNSYAFLFMPEDEYTSISKKVSMFLCNKLTKDIRFELEFRIEYKNKQINPSRTPTFISPGFPHGYVTNGEIFNYYIRIPFDTKLMVFSFSDWMMNSASKLIIDDSHYQFSIDGNSSRKIFKSDRSLNITFYTGNKSFFYRRSNIVRGFKLEVTLIRGPFDMFPSVPYTRCGGSNMFQMNYGSLVTFTSYQTLNYDCVWVIPVHPGFKMVSLHSVIFQTNSLDASVSFYEGLTSEGALVKKLKPKQNFVDQNPNGFYIRLRGRMQNGDEFSMTYASTTSSNDCQYGYQCRNGFCIRASLKCDGVNHCWDKSDETVCFDNERKVLREPISSNWSVSIIIPVVITIFIFIILCLFFIFVRRFRKISRGTMGRRSASRIAAISGNVSQQYLQNHFSMNLTFEELDAPPSYDEVMNTPPARGNWNLAFSWSQQELRDVPAPPPYSEYIQENQSSTYNNLADHDTSDYSTIPTDTSSSMNCTAPTSEDLSSTTESGSESIYATICDYSENQLDPQGTNRSTSDQRHDPHNDSNKTAAGGPTLGTEQSNEPLRKDSNEYQHYSDENGSSFLGAVSTKSSPALSEVGLGRNERPQNDVECPILTMGRQLSRHSRSRSMDLQAESGSNSLNEVPQGDPNGTFVRRNSYPPVLFLTDRQSNNEVFV